MIDSSRAEQAAIGCLLLDGSTLVTIRRVLPSPEVFGIGACREVYTATLDLADNGTPIDPVTVGRSCGASNEFLATCMAVATSCAMAETYALAVLDGYRRRTLRELAGTLTTSAADPAATTEETITAARGVLDELARSGAAGKVLTPSDSLRAFLAYREDVEEGRRAVIKTGLPSIDSMIGGFNGGGLYIIGARTSVGKSAFGIALADMIGKRQNVLYVSLEMSEEDINARRIAAFSEKIPNFSKLLHGKLNDKENADLCMTVAKLSERKLTLWCPPSATVAQIGVAAQNTKADVLFVDYLGLVSYPNKKASEYEKITAISLELKRLAKRLDIPVIALCQINREAEKGERPQLSQLRSSGAIEQDADAVLLLHRPEKDKQHPAGESQPFEVHAAKNRHGRCGAVALDWWAGCNRFEDTMGGTATWTAKSWT